MKKRVHNLFIFLNFLKLINLFKIINYVLKIYSLIINIKINHNPFLYSGT